jgi:PAS domain S-box-containing protein
METMTSDDEIFEATEPALLHSPPTAEQGPVSRRAPHEQSNFLRVLLDNLSDGIVACDRSGAISFRNRALLEMHGIALPFEADGAPYLFDLYVPGESEPMPADATPLMRTLRGEDLGVVELVLAPVGRPPRRVLIHAQRILDEHGEVAGALAVVRDVSERHELERVKDEFLSVVSHELRTPLTSIRAPLLLMTSGRVDPASEMGHTLLSLATANAERMTRLVNDIMDMQRLAHGKLSLEPEPLDALALASAAAASFAPSAEAAGVTLEVTGRAVWVMADPQRLEQVLGNLLDNAIDFSPSGGRVTVEVERRGAEVWFTVCDEGPGVPEPHREVVFGRFTQLEPSTTRKKQGLGLGLAISRDIVAQHGGKLWVEGREPKPGAAFKLALPIAAEPH